VVKDEGEGPGCYERMKNEGGRAIMLCTDEEGGEAAVTVHGPSAEEHREMISTVAAARSRDNYIKSSE